MRQREGGREEGREGGREEGSEGGREGEREGGRERGSEGGSEEGRKGGREGGREGEGVTDILYSQKFMRLNFLWVCSKSDINPFLQVFIIYKTHDYNILCKLHLAC